MITHHKTRKRKIFPPKYLFNMWLVNDAMSSFSSYPSSSTQPSSDSILAPEERRDKNQLLENVACRHNQEITKMDFMSYSTKTPHTTALLLHIIYASFSSEFCVFVCSLHFRRKSKTFFMSFFHHHVFLPFISFTAFLCLYLQQKRLACNDLKQHYPHHQQGNKKERKYLCCLNPSVKYIHPQAQYNISHAKSATNF